MHVDPVWVGVVMTVITALFIPVIALLIRGAVKWTQTEGQVAELVTGVKQLVDKKEEDHKEITAMIHDVVVEQTSVHKEMSDSWRRAQDNLDERLRFLERYWMQRGQDPK